MDRHRPRRAGFTLIEILIVIVIIGVLMALLLPALSGAFRTAKAAQVTAELNNLATALASFKNTYGDYPPSRIVLCEQGSNMISTLDPSFLTSTIPTWDNNDSDITGQQLLNRSLQYLRKFWPRADFVNSLGSTPGSFNDFDGDGLLSQKVIILNGSECLAFFLGGIPIRNSANPSAIVGAGGFNKSPRYPFVDLNPSHPNPALNRTTPNYEFAPARLVDLDGDQIASYLDPYSTPPSDMVAYAYFSAYGSNAYDPNDNNFGTLNGGVLNSSGTAITAGGGPGAEQDDTLTNYVERSFTVGFSPNTVTSIGPNPYTSGPEVSTSGSVSFINPNTFQLFSAGNDRLWGIGGQFNGSAPSGGRLPNNGGYTGSDPVIRQREGDNVTNFSGGRLD